MTERSAEAQLVGRWRFDARAGRLLVDPSARRMFRLPHGNVRYVDFLAAMDASARLRIDATFARALEGSVCREEVSFGGRVLCLHGALTGKTLMGTVVAIAR